MQDLNDKLTILHTVDDVAFQDLSMSAFNFLKGNFEVSDTLYVGFRKPINALFFSVQTPSGDGAEIEGEYFSDNWSALELHDETEALGASGFVRWVTPEDQTTTTIDGKSLYWVRLTMVLDNSATLSGVGPLLCSEEDLTTINFNLEEDASNILKAIVGARNLMCKELQASPWDILNLPDVSDAAAFLALSIIYSNQSDRDNDHYRILASDYLSQYKSLKAKIAITIDRNDNGVVDDGEKVKSSVVYFER